MYEDESICQRKQCDVRFSNVVLCVFRRTFFDVTQVFQRHCVENLPCRRFRSRDVELWCSMRFLLMYYCCQWCFDDEMLILWLNDRYDEMIRCLGVLMLSSRCTTCTTTHTTHWLTAMFTKSQQYYKQHYTMLHNPYLLWGIWNCEWWWPNVSISLRGAMSMGKISRELFNEFQNFILCNIV